MTNEERIRQFRAERGWWHEGQEKDLALSINLEAAELLELFQWKKSEEVVDQATERLQEELADVLIYAYMLAANLGFDVETIIADKLQKNAKKYPAKQ